MAHSRITKTFGNLISKIVSRNRKSGRRGFSGRYGHNTPVYWDINRPKDLIGHW